MTDLRQQERLLTIKVDSLRLRAYIGYLEWEQQKLQDVVLSYSLKYDGMKATAHDDVRYAVNYKDLNKQIIKNIDNQSFHLIETLAEQVYGYIIGFDTAIEEVEVIVEKPHALRFADNVMIHISSKERYNTVLIGLGSNIEAELNLDRAMLALARLGKMQQRTGFIYTDPLKYEEQAPFLNGAVLMQTTLSKRKLEQELKDIETLLGRVRGPNKNGPRAIDLDIVTFNGKLCNNDDLEELPFLKIFVTDLQPEVLDTVVR